MVKKERYNEKGELLRELKFKVPLVYHRKLYGFKIVTGLNLSHILTEAIQDYLDELEDEGNGVDESLLGTLAAKGPAKKRAAPGKDKTRKRGDS